MKKLLVGNFGSKNIGDLLILNSALEEFGWENCVVMVESDQSEYIQEFLQKKFETIDRVSGGVRSYLECFLPPSPRGRDDQNSSGNYNDNISEIIFVGGGLFAISLQACLVWAITFYSLVKKFPKIPIKFQYQGIDNDLGYFSRKIIQKVFQNNMITEITVRDFRSKNSLILQNIPKSKIEVKNDRVEQWLKNHVGRMPLARPQINNQNNQNIPYILINAVQKISENFYKKLSEKIQKKYGKNTQIYFLAFEPKDLENIPENFPGKVFVPKNITELFAKIKNSQALIGERLHSLVLGNFLAPNIYLLRTPYSEKVKNFSEKYKIEKL